MSNLASFGSLQASGWAAQRREAMEKAKQLKVERGNNLVKTGEMALSNTQYQQKPSNSNQRDNFGSRTAKLDSIDDYSNKRNLASTVNYSNREDVLGVRNQNVNYSEYPADKMNKGTMNRNTQNQQNPQMNQNYRKQYKPDFQTDSSQQNTRTGVTNDPYKLKTVPQDSYGATSDYSYNPKNQKTNYPSEEYSKPNTMTKPNPVKRNPVQQDYLDSFAGQPRGQQPQRKYEQDNYEDQRNYGQPRGQQQQQRKYEQDNYEDQRNFGQARGQQQRKYEQDDYEDQRDYGQAPKQQKTYNPSNYSRNQQDNKGYSATSSQRPISREISGAGNNNNQYQSSIKTSQPPANQNRRIAAPSNPIPDERPSGDEELVECPAGCGRSFFQHVLEKHAKNCQKVFQSKRKAFNAAAQRQTEDQQNIPTNPKKKPAMKSQNTMQQTQLNKTGTNKPIAVSKKPDWKQQSEAFRASMKVARGVTLSKDEQVAIAKNQQDGLVPCHHCGRRFNDKAAERHIPFCQSKQKIEALKKGPPKGATMTNKFKK